MPLYATFMNAVHESLTGTWIKFSGSWWELVGAGIPHVSLELPHTHAVCRLPHVQLQLLHGFNPCRDNTLVEMFDCQIFLSVLRKIKNNIFRNIKKYNNEAFQVIDNSLSLFIAYSGWSVAVPTTRRHSIRSVAFRQAVWMPKFIGLKGNC